MRYWIGCGLVLMIMGCASHTMKSAAPIAQAPAPVPAPPPAASFDVWNGVDLHWLGGAVRVGIDALGVHIDNDARGAQARVDDLCQPEIGRAHV